MSHSLSCSASTPEAPAGVGSGGLPPHPSLPLHLITKGGDGSGPGIQGAAGGDGSLSGPIRTQGTCSRTESAPQGPELSIWVSLMRLQEPVHLGCPVPPWSGFSGGPEAEALSRPPSPAPRPVRTPLRFPQQSSYLLSCLTCFRKKWTQGPLDSGGPTMNWPRPQHKATSQNQLTLCQVPWVTAFMAGAAGRGPKAGLQDVGITGAEIRPLSSRTDDKHHHESHLSWARQTRIDSTDKQLKALSRGPSSSSSYGPGTFTHLLRTRPRKKPWWLLSQDPCGPGGDASFTAPRTGWHPSLVCGDLGARMP